jgi:hypothetical protein
MNFFDDDDEPPSPGDRSTSAFAHQDESFSNRAASPKPYAPRLPPAAGRTSSTTGGRLSSITGGAANSSVRAYESTRGGSPTLEDILGEDTGGDGERNVEKLIRAWTNEVGAPELLRFPTRLVERVVKDLVRRVSLAASRPRSGARQWEAN